MSRESNPDREAAYEQALGEARRSRPEDLDWKRVESRLLARLDREPARMPAARGRWVGVGVAAGVALAALVMMVVVGIRKTAEPIAEERSAPTLVPTFASATNVESATLTEGRRFVAGAAGTTVRQPGLVEWRLAPGSSAEVKALHPSVVIQLQAGTLYAEVQPSAAPESFVVEVGGLRVAVHGTVFSVVREGDDALVRVTEGVVSVGKLGQVPTTLLRAPASARFAATGTRAGAHRQRKGNVSVVDAGVAPPAASSLEAVVLDEQLPLPKEPTFESVELGLAKTEDALGTCLREHAQNEGSVKLSLHTRVTLKVEADGSLGEYRFVPPLAPPMQACVDRNFASLRFSPSEVGALVIRDLEIER